MSRRSVVLFAGAVVLGLAIAAYTAPAKAQTQAQSASTTYNEDVKMDTEYANPCNGETIHITGTEHRVTTVSKDPQGNVVGMRIHINWENVGGVGLTSGATYRVMSNGNYSFSDLGQAPISITFDRENTLIIGKGRKGANVKVTQSYMLKYDGNGNPIFAKDGDDTPTCR
jgi:predicted dithiol-disulfide oxidoreductase (DUF899 family)